MDVGENPTKKGETKVKALLLSVVVLFFVGQAHALSLAPVHVTSAHTITAAEDIVYLEGTNTVVYHTLPSCAAGNDGESHFIRGNGNTHCHTINAATGNTIDGASGQAVCDFQAALMSCNGNGKWLNTGYFFQQLVR